MNCYRFNHLQFGKLRVVEQEGKVFYCLKDVMRIFLKESYDTFKTIAESDGEILLAHFTIAPPKGIQDNFLTDEEMGILGKRVTRKAYSDEVFIDAQLVEDLGVKKSLSQKLAAKWIGGYIPKVLASPVDALQHVAHGVLECGDYGLKYPIDVRFDGVRLTINGIYMTYK